MAPFRLPEKQLPLFKDFCNVTARNLATGGELPLIGRKLYDSFSRALSHQHYKALLNDSKSYGKGHFDWSDFYFRLMANLHESLGEAQEVTYEALTAAQLELRDKYDVMQEGGSTYSNVMNSEVADIDFIDVVNRQEHPVIDLSPLNSSKDPKDNILVMRATANQFLKMNKQVQSKVIFLGSKEQVELLLESEPTATCALLLNPSIKAHSIRAEYLPASIKGQTKDNKGMSEIVMSSASYEGFDHLGSNDTGRAAAAVRSLGISVVFPPSDLRGFSKRDDDDVAKEILRVGLLTEEKENRLRSKFKGRDIEYLIQAHSSEKQNLPSKVGKVISSSTTAKLLMKSDSNAYKFSDFYAWHIKDKLLKSVINLDTKNRLVLLATNSGVSEFADYRDVVIIRKMNAFSEQGNEMCIVVEGDASKDCINELLVNKLEISKLETIEEMWRDAESLNKENLVNSRMDMINNYGPKIFGCIGWNKAGRVMLRENGIPFSKEAMKAHCTLDAIMQFRKDVALNNKDMAVVENFLNTIRGVPDRMGIISSDMAAARDDFAWFSMTVMTDDELDAYPSVETLYRR